MDQRLNDFDLRWIEDIEQIYKVAGGTSERKMFTDALSVEVSTVWSDYDL